MRKCVNKRGDGNIDTWRDDNENGLNDMVDIDTNELNAMDQETKETRTRSGSSELLFSPRMSNIVTHKQDRNEGVHQECKLRRS